MFQSYILVKVFIEQEFLFKCHSETHYALHSNHMKKIYVAPLFKTDLMTWKQNIRKWYEESTYQVLLWSLLDFICDEVRVAQPLVSYVFGFFHVTCLFIVSSIYYPLHCQSFFYLWIWISCWCFKHLHGWKL